MSGGEEKNVDTVYCVDCGEKIRRNAEICPECGIRQNSGDPTVIQDNPNKPSESLDDERQSSSNTNLTEEYTIIQWIGSIIVGLITFPLGLLVPAYLFYKASNGTGKQQSSLEAWAAILFGILGIIAVELGGRTAAKILWGLFIIIILAIMGLALL